jgi:preprotein translocase subunit SecA
LAEYAKLAGLTDDSCASEPKEIRARIAERLAAIDEQIGGCMQIDNSMYFRRGACSSRLTCWKKRRNKDLEAVLLGCQ